jgi:oligoribonuclease NrnB/cAMP/cGMP phosphodiesterase (DHH superfamily)
MINPNDIDLVIYHHPCPDGCTSATIANMYYKMNNKKVEFWGLSHAGNSPHDLFDRLKDKNILICDFSFKKDVITKLMAIVKGLLIIDHHLSAKNDLVDLDQHYKIFDMDHCGAHLVWKYFFPEKPIPLFVRYIEDNDIWLKAMPNTLEVTAYVASLDLNFDIFEKFIINEDLIHQIVIPMGEILLKQAQKQIDSALSKSTIKMIEFLNNIYFVGLCNSTTNINEVGNQMLTKYPGVNFSIVYSYNAYETFSASLRSDESRTDVSIIASKCSGGGHRNASGCTFYTNPYPGFEIGNYNCYQQLRDLDFIINENGYNYVTLNTTQNKIQFAKYLLQTRTNEKTKNNENQNNEIQEACAYYRLAKSDNQSYIKFDFAITWHYGDNKTWFILHWAQHKDNSIKELLNKFITYDNYEVTENKRLVKFSFPGLHIIKF